MKYIYCLIIILICLKYVFSCYKGQVAIIHKESGIKYYVNNFQSDESKLKKVALLHELRQRLNKLMNIIENDEKQIQHKGVQRLIAKHRNNFIQLDELSPTIDFDRVFAFNMNKGERISICLSKENEINELFFVLLHEISHSMTVEYSHNAEFWTNFSHMIQIATDNNLYTNVDYRKNPKKFCNYSVNHNPYFDGQP